MNDLEHYRRQITIAGRTSERDSLCFLRSKLKFSTEERGQALTAAKQLVSSSRRYPHRRSMLDLFLSEFSLSTQEGIALLCICEALLRIPDDETADALIADKIGSADWNSHLGSSDSLFVNASTWALMLTGNVIRLGDDVTQNVAGWLKRLISRLGEGAAREAMQQGVQIVGNEFVVGETIESALDVAKRNYRHCSFDMLGEGARSYEDAKRYADSYLNAIEHIGKSALPANLNGSLGMSIKLSAIHPRFEYRQHPKVYSELLPTLLRLLHAAAKHDIPVTVDAEESYRLDLTLNVFSRLVEDQRLADWNGLGIAVQAYSPRSYAVIEWLQALAATYNRSLNVRLVKGAYWDTEVKHAQLEGLANYPVFTRKPSTDLSWLVCAEKLFDSPNLYPQIATHNAFSVAAAMQISKKRDFEFQRLHGMGELLYTVAHESPEYAKTFPPVRVYAPVGDHENLLAYLVRRLLENGANTSFVNRFLDDRCPVEEVVQDPVHKVDDYDCNPHPNIPIPRHLFGEDRPNSIGLDYGDEDALCEITSAMSSTDIVVTDADETNDDEIQDAFQHVKTALPTWRAKSLEERKRMLYVLAELLHKERVSLIRLMHDEAGKTLIDAVAEIREAIDFCHYYGDQCAKVFLSKELSGPTGEENVLSYSGRGIFVCISPWNFPLAIFLGQVAAALAAGNGVVAKPAEQTPKIASFAIQLLYKAGFPDHIVELVIGGRKVGQSLIEHKDVSGVAFTGSLATAKQINLTLATKEGPIVPLIAETGGVNAMVLDSSILFEQAIDDIVDSAFRSAGQRCSALRLLCVQEEIFESFLSALTNAMKTLILGNALDIATDVGPIIDREAYSRLSNYIKAQTKNLIFQVQPKPKFAKTHIAPTLIRVHSVSDLMDEHFGPILHVMSFKEGERTRLLQEISQNGFGLTFGVHTRIDQRAAEAVRIVQAGNMYVNRNMIGATVGVQPFGGHSLSGTGPKAGGPNYLIRFAHEFTTSTNLVTTGGNPQLLNLAE